MTFDFAIQLEFSAVADFWSHPDKIQFEYSLANSVGNGAGIRQGSEVGGQNE